MPASKYTAFHVPRTSPLLDDARELAKKIRDELPIAARVPMYAAMEMAVREALDRRQSQCDTAIVEALTRRMTQFTDPSTEVDQ